MKHGTWNVERVYAPDLDAFATTSVVLTRDTEFGDMYLMEVARGCGRGCRFCMARSITGPVRQRSVTNLLAQAKEGLQYRRKIGLVGAATSDYPQMAELVAGLRGLGARIGVSSLRADSLTPELLRALVESGTRTITLAPEAGSQRLRQSIGKGLSEDDLQRAAELCRAQKVPALKLYFMVGLPGETEDDVLDIARLSQEIAAWSGSKITVSVAPFVPKAQTPLERVAMLETSILKQRLESLKSACRATGIGYKVEGVEWSAVQGVLARGDRRLAQVLLEMQANTLAEWQRAMSAVGLQMTDYLRERAPEETLPWSFLETGD